MDQVFSLRFDLWVVLIIAAVAFVLGRITAKDPIQRERERREQEATLRRHRAEIKPDTLAAARDLVSQGRKIEAIKLVREQMSIGLKEAKDLVETLER